MTECKEKVYSLLNPKAGAQQRYHCSGQKKLKKTLHFYFLLKHTKNISHMSFKTYVYHDVPKMRLTLRSWLH